ncbi:MAG: hypothetical protein ACOYM9_22245 [Bradymonadia bacterium]
MANPSEEGPNWFWRLAELSGVTWPGRRVAKGPPPPKPPRCSACRNPTRRDPVSESWRCPYHPQASVLEE